MRPIDHLVLAALEGDAVSVMRAVGADAAVLGERTMFGVGVIHAADAGGHERLVERLVAAAGGLGARLAAELGRVDVVEHEVAVDRSLLGHAADGSTLLHAAAYFGRSAVVQRLLELGAHAGAVSRDPFLQIPVLGSAAATTPGVPQPSDNEDVVLTLVRLLLEAGADVNARRGDGMTVLHTAAFRGLDRVAQELLDAGADSAITAASGPHSGETAADTALGQGHLALACRLDAGADVANPYG